MRSWRSQSRRRWRIWLPLLLLVLLIPALPAISVQAATRCVNPGGTGGCFASIQAAVNASLAGDTIMIAPGTYSELVTIGKSLSINGAGPGMTIIDGGNQYGNPAQVVTVTSGSSWIAGVTIRNGWNSGIGNAATLTVFNSAVSNNSSGIINNASGTLTLTHVTLGPNAAYGLFNSGQMTVAESTVTGNSLPAIRNMVSGTAALNDVMVYANVTVDAGGGVSNSGVMSITNSTIANNIANGGAGGGIVNRGTMTITNATISNNASHGIPGDNQNSYGGGIANNGTLTVTNSTLSDNSATFGAGISNAMAASVTIRNSLLANPGNCFTFVLGQLASGDYNLTTDASCGAAMPHDRVVADPMLLPLAYNGGPTPTMALQPGSPAIDAIPATGAHCPATDQRGFPRPYGVGCDIGAFESTVPQMAPVPRGGGAPSNGTPSPIPPPRPGNPVSLPPPRTDAPVVAATPQPLPPRR